MDSNAYEIDENSAPYTIPSSEGIATTTPDGSILFLHDPQLAALRQQS